MTNEHGAAFYQALRGEAMQGDIFDFVPSASIRDDIDLLKPFDVKGGRRMYARYRVNLANGETDGARYGNVVPAGLDLGEANLGTITYRFDYGLLLTHSCDIENEDYRVVALIRSLADIADAEDRETIRGNQNYNYFYLPAFADVIVEGYVDLRMNTTLHRDVLGQCNRVASLADDSLRALYTQLFLCMTHAPLDPEIVNGLNIEQ